MSFSTKKIKIIVTCEHAGNKIPHDYLPLFKGREEILQTHKGMDIGVKDAFNQFKKISDFWLINHQSRLLIEFNRSLHHFALFSEFSKTLPKADKEHLIQHYYAPYRKRLEKSVSDFLGNGNIVYHLSIHSFTPIFNNQERYADIGLLYDPAKNKERSFCMAWRKEFLKKNPEYSMRMNYPYHGKSDGLTTYLRKLFGLNYIGIEVELNQKHQDIFASLSEKMIESMPHIQ